MSAHEPKHDTSPRPRMVFADAEGHLYEHPELAMLGFDGDAWRPLEPHEVQPLPKGSDLFSLPGRQAVGLDEEADEVVVYDEPGTTAASCFVAPAYLRTLLPAYHTLADAPALPLFAYSSVGWLDGQLVAPCLRVDEDIRQDPFRFDIADIERRVEARKRAEGADNRLIDHLSHCALVYHCRAAQNFFLDRFEAPMPAAPTCNAFCVGCISLQPKGGDDQTVAAHDRIQFAPTADELAGVALGHIRRVGADAVVSFGQGCEGEPLTQHDELTQTVARIRAETSEGVVNLNSNASRPDVVEAMRHAGLDSLRVSTNSARSHVYDAYYRPKGYSLDDVKESSRRMKALGGYVMLNYFVFPGVTDTRDELDALTAWISEVGIDMVQLRNLNIDPDTYLETVAKAEADLRGVSLDQLELDEPMGIVPWLREVRRRFPDLRFGYFNPPRRVFTEPAPQLVPPAEVGAGAAANGGPA